MAQPEDREAMLDSSRRPQRRARSSREGRWLAVVAVALLLGASAAAVFLFFPVARPPAPPISVELVANSSAEPFRTSPEFWGGNIGTSSPVAGALTGDAAATPVDYFRWPGGQAGDGINYSSGLLYNATTGVPSAVTTNLSTFVAWCVEIGCRAMLQLPAEIDSPATAAYDVAYTENVLGFRPSYWEIGNEPALWTHFRVPWTQWNATQADNVTPVVFAHVVQAYIGAIRGVDPTAAIVGLGGVGTGAFEEPQWIAATVATNGPNLSAVAIHVYPAGSAPSGTASLAGFYANLTASLGLPDRVPLDRAAIAGACPSCSGLQLLVTEFGSGSGSGSYAAFESGFPQVPYIADEVASGLALNVTGLYLRQLATPHMGSWVDSATGSVSPVLELYTEVFPQLHAIVLPTRLVPAFGSVVAVATESAPNGTLATLVVNADPSSTVELRLVPPEIAAGAATVLQWNSSTPGPVVGTTTLNGSPVWRLPPMSVLLVLSGTGGPATFHGLPAREEPTHPGTAGVPLPSGPLGGSWPATAIPEDRRWASRPRDG